MSTETNPLWTYFKSNPGRAIEKWEHYFDVYHRHFDRFRGRPITILEIGVCHGGSLQMWRQYFGPQARIVGVDVDPRAAFEEPGIEVIIGDQGDRRFLRELVARYGTFDIVIDDGGHTMAQQYVSLEELFPSVKEDGVYLVEDTHTSYWTDYGGGFRNPHSFIELTKRLIDLLHAYHSRDSHSFVPTGFTGAVGSLHFYDSIVVIERARHEPPKKCGSGRLTIPATPPPPG